MKKGRIYCLVLIGVMLLLSACSAQKKDMSYSNSKMENDTGSGSEIYYGSTDGLPPVKANVAESLNGSEDASEVKTTSTSTETSTAASANKSDTSRKRIRRIGLNLETLEFNNALKAITEEIQKSGGYVESSSINGSNTDESGSRSAEFILRIPVDKTDGFVQTMGNSMNLVHKEESSEDITLKYVDTESKVKTLKIEQERLLAILQKTEKIEDIIALEDRLSEVRYQLEQNASTLRTYDNLVEYSTITLDINEVLRLSPPEKKSTVSRMSTGLSNSLLNMRDAFLNVAVWLVANLPYLLFWGLIIGLSILISMKLFYKKEKKQYPLPTANTDTKKKEEGSGKQE